jgi:phosphoribosylanthranilate isomerase
MREPENIRAVASLDIDLMGFIFYPKSSRYVQMISSKAGIIPDYSVERLRGLKARNGENETAKTGDPVDADALPARVGVFVDDMPQNIVTRVYNYSLDYVQLHGDESPVMIENLRRTLDPDIAPRIKIIKALSIRSEEDVRRWRDYKGLVDLFLFDTPTEGYGGSGEKFDWTALEAYDGDVPFLLSGGIGPADAERIKSFQHPQFAGIDLNSQFETAPGVKDVELLRTFIAKIRNEQN